MGEVDLLRPSAKNWLIRHKIAELFQSTLSLTLMEINVNVNGNKCTPAF